MQAHLVSHNGWNTPFVRVFLIHCGVICDETKKPNNQQITREAICLKSPLKHLIDRAWIGAK